MSAVAAPGSQLCMQIHTLLQPDVSQCPTHGGGLCQRVRLVVDLPDLSSGRLLSQPHLTHTSVEPDGF